MRCEREWSVWLDFIDISKVRARVAPTCTINLNTQAGALPIGRGPLAYLEDLTRGLIDPSVDNIGPGTRERQHYYFYEVAVLIQNYTAANLSRWTPYQRVVRTVLVPLILNGGTELGDDVFKRDLRRDPDNPDERNVVRSPLLNDPRLLLWLDTPSALAELFGKQVVSGKVRWEFYFEGRLDGKAVCKRSLTLFLTYDNGTPRWSVLQ